MADEYDPSTTTRFNGGDDSYNQDEYEAYEAENDTTLDGNAGGDEEESDYDPSSFNFGGGNDNTASSAANSPYQQVSAQAAAPVAKAKTRAGFIVDESDDEKEEDDVPPPSQVDGSAGAQSGLGAVAVAEAQDMSLVSAPSDTVAASTSLNGSTSVPVTTSVSSLPDASLQPSATDQGKTTSAVLPAPSTPQPQTTVSSSVNLPAASTSNTNGLAATNSAPAPSQAPARLPHDKVGQLEDRIKDDPKGDANAWISLIDHYREKGQYDFTRGVFERFFKVFPYSVAMWIKYTQMEKELDETNNVVQILNQSLMNVPNVQLWHLYLEHVRRALPLINDADGKNRGEITAAFEATLDNVGIDPDSGFLWRDYIDFIKEGPGTVGGSGWLDGQKVDTLRKAYQRSFKIPHSEYFKLWKEYELFEKSLHAQTARKNIESQSPHYMQCRTARTQLEQLIDGLDRISIPRLPPIHGCAGEDEFGDQVVKWRAWIAWEVNEDPLAYRGTEDDAYHKRVLYVFRQATMFLCFYPEIWFEAATWCFSQGGEKLATEGEQFLERGIAANPESVLLALMKADRVESSLDGGNTDEVLIRNGERLDLPFEGVHKALYGLRTKMQDRDKRILAQIQEHFASLPLEEEPANAEDDEDHTPGEIKPKGRELEMKMQVDAIKAASAAQLDKLKRIISSVWVAKMQAFRRVQGQGKPTKKGDTNKSVKGFRGVFSESRPRGMLSSDVYIASALMEWNCYRDPSAVKIFERGMKLFPSDETFILEYIKHLIAGGDLTNARVVFESTMKKIGDAADLSLEQKRQKCRRLLGYMHDHESKYGDLAQIHKVEKRMKELYPDEPDISRFSHRYALPEFDAIDTQLILSPTQAQPKSFQPHPLPQPVVAAAAGLDVPKTAEGVEILLGPNGPYVASPKRPLEDSDTESPQRKFIRAESPLKGAAGYRIQASKGNSVGNSSGFSTKTFIPNQPPPQPLGPAPLPQGIETILHMLPNARSYNAVRLEAEKLVSFLPSVYVDVNKAVSARGR